MASTDIFSPTSTAWSVATFNDEGVLGTFKSIPWIFNEGVISSDSSGKGAYVRLPGLLNTFSCEYVSVSTSGSNETYKITFVTHDRFFATKNGCLYLFGKKVAMAAPVAVCPLGEWSVAAFDNNGVVEAFSSTPWVFQAGSVLSSLPHFTGSHKPFPEMANTHICDIGGGAFEIIFLTDNRFIATKNGVLWRFGKRICKVTRDTVGEKPK